MAPVIPCTMQCSHVLDNNETLGLIFNSGSYFHTSIFKMWWDPVCLSFFRYFWEKFFFIHVSFSFHCLGYPRTVFLNLEFYTMKKYLKLTVAASIRILAALCMKLQIFPFHNIPCSITSRICLIYLVFSLGPSKRPMSYHVNSFPLSSVKFFLVIIFLCTPTWDECGVMVCL